MNLTEIEEEVNKRFHAGVRKWMEEENAKRDTSYFHVTSLVYKCKRKVWYESQYYDLVNKVDDASLSRMWIGTKLHETPISEMHEFPVWFQFEGASVGGRIDEIMEIDGKKFIIDKKFVSYIPKEANEHYMEQVTFYAALYYLQKGVFVDGIGIHYYKPTASYDDEGGKERTFIKLLTQEEILKFTDYIKDMVSDISNHIKNHTLPDPYQSWYCKYCPYRLSCAVDSKEFIESKGA